MSVSLCLPRRLTSESSPGIVESSAGGVGVTTGAEVTIIVRAVSGEGAKIGEEPASTVPSRLPDAPVWPAFSETGFEDELGDDFSVFFGEEVGGCLLFLAPAAPSRAQNAGRVGLYPFAGNHNGKITTNMKGDRRCSLTCDR